MLAFLEIVCYSQIMSQLIDRVKNSTTDQEIYSQNLPEAVLAPIANKAQGRGISRLLDHVAKGYGE